MHENQRQRALHIAEGEGKRLWVADQLMTFKVSSEDTGGMYAFTDSVVPPQGEAPLHVHHREDEAFWVLEGELEILVGEDTFRASAGSFVHLPKGVRHAYKNVGMRPARSLTLIVPGQAWRGSSRK